MGPEHGSTRLLKSTQLVHLSKRLTGTTWLVQDKNGKKWKVVVKAPLVIAACGAIQTPALLLRSGIKGGGQVGKHLHLHPATAVMGIFDKVRRLSSSLPCPALTPLSSSSAGPAA
jgi:GMC oxidoreductase